MSPVDNYRLTRAQNTIAESVRVAVRRTLVSLGMSDNAEACTIVIEALRDVGQTYQIARDMAVDPTLADASAWEKCAHKCPADLADAVHGLLGKAGR